MASGTVKRAGAECVGPHPSKVASTNHVTVPDGIAFVRLVSPLRPTSCGLPLSIDAKTLYSVAPVTELQVNVTGDVTAAPFAGERFAGAS